MGKKKFHTFYWGGVAEKGGYSDDLVWKKTKQNEKGETNLDTLFHSCWLWVGRALWHMEASV